jgi:hypothetical protein
VANANDPLGRAAERIALNAFVVQTSSSIANWTGDQNGLRDLQMKNTEASQRLNFDSTTAGAGVGTKMFDGAFAYCGFGLEFVST